jgi:hypothetical protein
MVLRILLCAIVTMLLADASGALAFVSPETCTSVTDTNPDGTCPALCVRCGCCAQPTVTAVPPLFVSEERVSAVTVDYAHLLTVGSPHDILHVPR